MRIGIDIDGVLTDVAKFVLDYGTKFRYVNNIHTEMDMKNYNEGKALGLTNEQTEKFWNEYLEFYATHCSVRDFASEVIKKLKKEHEIYIITARNEEGLPKESYGRMQEFVKKWLSDNQIEYDKLIFTGKSKLNDCVENNIDIMIDDAPCNVLELGSKVHVFCFDNPYNEEVEGKNSTRVYSWYDILDKIEERTHI